MLTNERFYHIDERGATARGSLTEESGLGQALRRAIASDAGKQDR